MISLAIRSASLQGRPGSTASAPPVGASSTVSYSPLLFGSSAQRATVPGHIGMVAVQQCAGVHYDKIAALHLFSEGTAWH